MPTFYFWLTFERAGLSDGRNKRICYMKKFEGMLFCTDLDGTLYSDDKQVSKENLQAIEYFKSEGGYFTFITGRVPKTSEAICRTIQPNAPFGCMNGGAIYDPQKERYLWSLTLPEKALELVKCVDLELPEIGIQFNTEDAVLFYKDNEALKRFREITGRPLIPCSYEQLKQPLLKVVFAHFDDRQIAATEELLNRHPDAEKYDFIRSERALYELLPKGASKGAALCKLAELLGIDIANTVAVGDFNNDVSMIQAAGIGYAVENAVAEAKAVADRMTVSNNHHAIAAIVEELEERVKNV